MEQVFPLERGTGLLLNGAKKKAVDLAPRYKEGIVESKNGFENFVVVLDDGNRINVRGSESLKLGARVKLLLSPNDLKKNELVLSVPNLMLDVADGLQWLILIPLAFGGGKALARLEVFVERQKEGAGPKMDLATYFVFTVETAESGELQWSIHLKGRQLTLQVFTGLKAAKLETLKKMIFDIEVGLKNQGFLLAAPAVLLRKPFKVPAGFRLNIRG